jgi:hypothetical protein
MLKGEKIVTCAAAGEATATTRTKARTSRKVAESRLNIIEVVRRFGFR